jgi:hypothetical protein
MQLIISIVTPFDFPRHVEYSCVISLSAAFQRPVDLILALGPPAALAAKAVTGPRAATHPRRRGAQ